MNSPILTLTLIFILICVFGSAIICNTASINQCPTYTEIDSIFKANSSTIFDKKNVGRLESCLYMLIEIERGEAYSWELEPYLHWLVDRNEQRIEEKNDELKD